MENFLYTELKKMGYHPNAKAQDIMEICRDWYRNDVIENFHKRTTVNGESYMMDRTGFAKKACEDDANLCEVVDIKLDDEGANTFITSFLQKSSFQKCLREQLELISAEGTVGAYVRVTNAELMEDRTLQGGELELVYVEPENVIPLQVENKQVTECAFVGQDVVNGKNRYTLIIFKQSEENYISETRIYDYRHKEIRDLRIEAILGEVKPFAILTTAAVNNLKDMQGYGYPKLYGAIPSFKLVDLTFNVLNGDLDKADKMVLYNEALCDFGADGKPRTPNKMHKRVFVPLGQKLPDEKDLVKEINPVIRIDDITKSMELALSLVSMQFGYGTRKYSFENGQIKTATEYIGTKQDSMQELNKQRQNLTEYIQTIVGALLWFSNAFLNTKYNINTAVNVDYDDSYITDTESELASMREDAQNFGTPKLVIAYFMRRYNLDEKTATAWYEGSTEPMDDTTLDI